MEAFEFEGSGRVQMSGSNMPVRRQELLVFLFFTVVLAPLLSIALVGGYGFAIWMYQLLSGPPTG
jgi:nitrate reductase NapE